ncbi:MAG: hypothetical protein O3B08_08895 [Proteobacteria bacterium]|nr:hypothetical protein [Pseudomonadota bacterium]
MSALQRCECESQRRGNGENIAGDFIRTAERPIEYFSDQDVCSCQYGSKYQQCAADPYGNSRYFFRTEEKSVKHGSHGVDADCLSLRHALARNAKGWCEKVLGFAAKRFGRCCLPAGYTYGYSTCHSFR